MKKITVIFHCIVLDAKLQNTVINENDERLKIRCVNFKWFLLIFWCVISSVFYSRKKKKKAKALNCSIFRIKEPVLRFW